MAGEALIVEAARTPVGRRGGMLAGWHPADLLAEVLSALVERAGVDPAEVDDVIVGCVDQVGEQGVNVGRSAALAAGFPETVPATTIDRQCGTPEQAAHFAAQGRSPVSSSTGWRSSPTAAPPRPLRPAASTPRSCPSGCGARTVRRRSPPTRGSARARASRPSPP